MSVTGRKEERKREKRRTLRIASKSIAFLAEWRGGRGRKKRKGEGLRCAAWTISPGRKKKRGVEPKRVLESREKKGKKGGGRGKVASVGRRLRLVFFAVQGKKGGGEKKERPQNFFSKKSRSFLLWGGRGKGRKKRKRNPWHEVAQKKKRKGETQSVLNTKKA